MAKGGVAPKRQVKQGRIVTRSGASPASAEVDHSKLKSISANRKAKVAPTQSGPALSKREQDNLIFKYRLKARRLASSILRRWNSRIDMQELESVVDLSLCEAVKRFDPKRGASFLTFLFYHLRGNLIRAVTYAATLNLVPSADLSTHGHKEESGEEAGNPNALEIAAALCSEGYQSPEEALFNKELKAVGEDVRGRLDPLEREIIERIYLKEQQLIDIASTLGYSRCHISRLKRKALDYLQEGMEGYLSSADELPGGAVAQANDEQKRGSSSASERRFNRPKAIAALQRIAKAA